MTKFKKPMTFTDVPIESAKSLFEIVPTIFRDENTTTEEQRELIHGIADRISAFSNALESDKRDELQNYISDSVNRLYTRDNFFYVLGVIHALRSDLKFLGKI